MAAPPIRSAGAESDPPAHVVLVSPEIPPNTGSIARLCAAVGVRLHLVRPLGFSLDDRYLKRAGLDYWPYVDLRVHDDWAAFVRAEAPRRVHCFSARAARTYLDIAYARGDYLVFGSETAGLPATLLEAYGAHTYVIPIRNPQVRSLNLSNAVSIVVYEAWRRLGSSD